MSYEKYVFGKVYRNLSAESIEMFMNSNLKLSSGFQPFPLKREGQCDEPLDQITVLVIFNEGFCSSCDFRSVPSKRGRMILQCIEKKRENKFFLRK